MTTYDCTILRFDGPDAASFLQGQLTQDVERLSEASGQLAAWCNAKGRVVALGRLINMNGAIGLALPSGIAAAVREKITVYRMRAKLTIELADDWNCVAVQGGTAVSVLQALGLGGEPIFQTTVQHGAVTAVVISPSKPIIEVFGPTDALHRLGVNTRSMPAAEDWQTACIKAGIPQIREDCSGLFTPHMLNLDLLGGVSFSKGCYPGQEVVARTQYLGETRRRLQRFLLVSPTAAKPGEKISLGTGLEGRLVNVAGNETLAVAPREPQPDPTIASAQPLAYPLPQEAPD